MHDQPPFHDANKNPLPSAADIEREFTEAYSPDQPLDASRQATTHRRHQRLQADRRKLRNLMVGLLVLGLGLGALLATGLVWGLNRLDLIDPQSPETLIEDR